MCLINNTQYCDECGASIRSPIQMDLCLNCEDKLREARRRVRAAGAIPPRRIKVDPIKGDLREAQIEKRRKIVEDAVKRAKKKPVKKSGRKSKTLAQG